jgi:hypothetical protein
LAGKVIDQRLRRLRILLRTKAEASVMCAFNLRFLAIQPAKSTEYSETLGGPASGCFNQP